MTTMRAFRLVEWQRPPELVEVDIPRPGPGEILVKVAGNGLCHSDITMMQMPREIGEVIGWQMPFTLGHEAAGWVEEVGAGVTKVVAGDPVMLRSPSSCGACDWCVRGQDSACPHGDAGRGYGRDGGLAEYVLAGSERDVIKLRSLDPVAAGPLSDAGATAHHAVASVVPKLVAGSTAVVIGAGGLGSFGVQLLRVLSPARVIAVDSNPARLEFARELGAHEVLGSVGDLPSGQAHAVLDFVGIDETIAAGLGAVRRAGAFVLIGAAGGTFRGPWQGGLPRDADIMTFQGSTVADAQAVVALAESGLIRSEVDRFTLDRVEDAYRALDEGTLRGRAVVTP